MNERRRLSDRSFKNGHYAGVSWVNYASKLQSLMKLKANADAAAYFVRLHANNKRLMIICELMGSREMSVGSLTDTLVG